MDARDVYRKEETSFADHDLMRGPFVDLVIAHVLSVDRVLDIGCGSGRLTRTIAPHVREIIGIDTSELLLVAARAYDPGIEYLVMDGESLDLDDSFDAVISHAVINRHMCRAERAYPEAYRVLKPGGVLIVAQIADTWGSEFGFDGGYALEDVEKLLERAGFTDIRIERQSARVESDTPDELFWLRDTEAAAIVPDALESFLAIGRERYAFDDSFLYVFARRPLS